jgi:hypothetical protein
MIANFLELSPSEASNSVAIKPPTPYGTRGVHYRIHNSPPLDPVVGQDIPAHTFSLDLPMMRSDVSISSTLKPTSVKCRKYRPLHKSIFLTAFNLYAINFIQNFVEYPSLKVKSIYI